MDGRPVAIRGKDACIAENNDCFYKRQANKNDLKQNFSGAENFHNFAPL
jgi:hypothetical protein